MGVIGLLALIDSFLHWADLSLDDRTYSQYNWDGWNAGLGAWLPLLLLLAFGVDFALPIGLSLLAALVGALSFVIILVRWMTLPSYLSASMSAAFGLYIGLLLAIAAAVFGWLGYTAEGGTFKTIGDSLKRQSPAGSYDQGPYNQG